MSKQNQIIKQIDEMSGRDFELYTGYLIQLLGFKHVIITRATGDFGIDVIGNKNGKRIGIQCKNYTKNSVGYHAVEEVCGGCKYYGLDHGIVLTNSDFSNPAIRGAKRCNVGLIGRKGIIHLTNHLLNQITIKNPSSKLFKHILKISDKNTKRQHHLNDQRIKDIINGVGNIGNKDTYDRQVLNKAVNRIRHEKQDIIRIAHKNTKILKACHKERQAKDSKKVRHAQQIADKYRKQHWHQIDIQNKKIYQILTRNSLTAQLLFPNPKRIDYGLTINNLIYYLYQCVNGINHHNYFLPYIYYRASYKTKEHDNVIGKRLKTLAYYLNVLNQYYTTLKSTWSIKLTNRLAVKLDRLISDPILNRLYNYYYNTQHICGVKRDKPRIRQIIKHRVPYQEFMHTYKIMDTRHLKKVIRLARLKARGTKSVVNFLPISQQDLSYI